MTNVNPMKVLVYGATGSQMRPVVLKLLEHRHLPYVLTRHLDKAADLQAAGARIVIGELADPVSLQAASAGMDAVALLIPAFLANPLEAVTYGRSAIDAAKAAGVKLLVWNTSGSMSEKRTGNPLNDTRLDLLDYLRHSQLPHILIEPTVYMENLLGPWTTQSVISRNQVSYPVLAERPMGWITSADVAALLVSALEHPELAGSRLKVSGIEALTGPQLAEQFAQALGRDITYYAMTPEEMGAAIDQAFGPGAGEAVADSYRKERENPNPPPTYYDMRPVLEKLPVKMTTIKEWVTKNSVAFAPVLS